MAASQVSLYERDFYVWARKQAAGLKQLAATRPNVELDWPNLISEVNELALDYRDTCRSQLRQVIVHLLKLEHSPARDPRPKWVHEIGEARAVLDDKLSASLRRDLRLNLAKIYARPASSPPAAWRPMASTRPPPACLRHAPGPSTSSLTRTSTRACDPLTR